jgi:hypothetical protein
MTCWMRSRIAEHGGRLTDDLDARAPRSSSSGSRAADRAGATSARSMRDSGSSPVAPSMRCSASRSFARRASRSDSLTIVERKRSASSGDIAVEQRLRSAPDGGERSAQLVAHVGDEARLAPLLVLELADHALDLVGHRVERLGHARVSRGAHGLDAHAEKSPAANGGRAGLEAIEQGARASARELCEHERRQEERAERPAEALPVLAQSRVITERVGAEEYAAPMICPFGADRVGDVHREELVSSIRVKRRSGRQAPR